MPCTDMRFTDYGTDYRVHCCRSYNDYGSVFQVIPVYRNGFMALRNIMYTPEGGSLTVTVIADIMLIVISVIAGYVSFRRMDILKKSDWRV